MVKGPWVAIGALHMLAPHRGAGGVGARSLHPVGHGTDPSARPRWACLLLSVWGARSKSSQSGCPCCNPPVTQTLVEPFDSGLLTLRDGAQIYWETSGNPKGCRCSGCTGGPEQAWGQGGTSASQIQRSGSSSAWTSEAVAAAVHWLATSALTCIRCG